MNRYSQGLEQDFVIEFFGEHYKGNYIEIGAFDGITNSNTYQLELNGWSGICIEPSPGAYRKLLKNRKSPLTTFYNVAIVADKSRRFADMTIFDTIPQFNGIAPSADKVEREQAVKNVVANAFTIRVKINTLNNILSASPLKNQLIDFVSIDVEGTELDVLEGFDFGRWQPKLFCIENNDTRNAHLNEYMENRGYIVNQVMGISTFFTPK